MIHILNKENSILNHFLAEIRNVAVQQDRMRFRRNIARIGEIMAYHVSQNETYTHQTIQTPLGETTIPMLVQQPVVATILRAGLPFQQGFLNYFDHADAAFISAYRKHKRGDDFEIKVDYLSSPQLGGRTLILCDPMLATGQSLVQCYKAILAFGIPEKLILCSVIASDEGVAYTRQHLPQATIYTAALDMELTAKSYIVPGLGDAGDLAFGEKV